MKMNKPKEIVKLLMAYLVAMQEGIIIALWTKHAKEQARKPERNAPSMTKTTSAANRQIVLEPFDRKKRWYLSFDKDGSPSIAINDSLYGAMFLTYSNDGTWLVKSVIHHHHYKRGYEALDLESILGLIEQYNKSAVVQEAKVEEDSPVQEAVEEDSPVQEAVEEDSPVQEIREKEITREEARLRLRNYGRKTLLQLRRHLELTGNGTGKRGAISTENAIESILTFMDGRENYDLDF